MKHVATARLVLAAAVTLFAISGALAQVPRGHAHNDYEHARPLADALAHGFTSIEADIWMRDGELLIGHDEADLDPSRTLRSLYLDPLRAAVAGRDASDPLLLLIDIKTDGPATYAALDEVLSDYADVLTRVEDGQVIPGPVMAVVSGNRPGDEMLADPSRYAFYDGRLSDLENGPSRPSCRSSPTTGPATSVGRAAGRCPATSGRNSPALSSGPVRQAIACASGRLLMYRGRLATRSGMRWPKPASISSIPTILLDLLSFPPASQNNESGRGDKWSQPR